MFPPWCLLCGAHAWTVSFGAFVSGVSSSGRDASAEQQGLLAFLLPSDPELWLSRYRTR